MKRSANVCLILVIAVLFSTILGSGGAQELQTGSAEWPMFHSNIANNGYSDSASPTTNETLWAFNTGGQVGSAYIHEGIVYVGSYDRNIYAIYTANG